MFAVWGRIPSAFKICHRTAKLCPSLKYYRHASTAAGSDPLDNVEDDDEDTEPEAAPMARGLLPNIREREIDHLGRAYGTGRRKTSVARVWIREGCGQIVVNDKNFADYFSRSPRQHIMEAFVTSKTSGFFDVLCTAKGGGPMGELYRVLI